MFIILKFIIFVRCNCTNRQKLKRPTEHTPGLENESSLCIPFPKTIKLAMVVTKNEARLVIHSLKLVELL